MTSIIEKTVALVAPHRCVICGVYNNIACLNCVKTLPRFAKPFCLLCGNPGTEWQPCKYCALGVKLDGLWAYAEYSGLLQVLVKEYKFNFIREAARSLAVLLDSCLPELDEWHIVHVPTASPRVRWRGYDQAKQLAQELARVRNKPFIGNALARTHNKRQVGASRSQRQVQAESLFVVHRSSRIKGKKLLIIDDVCTTGATLTAAAAALTNAGARQVAAATVVWQPPKSSLSKQSEQQ